MCTYRLPYILQIAEGRWSLCKKHIITVFESFYKFGWGRLRSKGHSLKLAFSILDQLKITVK
jgi:hypothetical protein